MIDSGFGPAAADDGQAAPADETRLAPFEFRGRAGEFFGIWIVNVLLTVLTLGIYSAWAKVRTQRYFYASTILDGKPFDYTADPVAILKGRIIAVIAFAIWYLSSTFLPLLSFILLPPLLIAMPWVIVRSLRFRAINTRYRNLRFHFYGTYKEAAMAYLLWPLLGLLTVGILWPYAAFCRARFTMNNLGFGDRRFNFLGNVSAYYSIWLRLLGFIVLAVGLLVLVLGLVFFVGGLATGVDPADPGQAFGIASIIIMGLSYLFGFFAFYVFPPAYIKAREGNYLVNSSETAGHLPYSNMRVRDLFWIYSTNLVAIVFTLGLAIPWAMIRAARYRLEHTGLEIHGSLDTIEAGKRDRIAATGEELGEVFDIDIGL